MNRVRKPQILRFASYPRCSTDDQAEGDFSTIQSQHDANIEYINARLQEGPGEYAGCYADEGWSGKLTSRPGINRLLTDVRAGKVNVVVVTFMSRLGRGDAFTILEYLLKEAGAVVHLVKQKFEPGIGGYLAKQSTTMMDGFYPLVVSAAVRAKQETMIKRGYWMGSPTPFGCKTVIADGMVDSEKKKAPRRLVSDPATHPFLIRAFEIYDETEAVARVKAYLQEVAGSHRKWNYHMVKHLLSNEVYRGVLVFGLLRNESAHDPIIPPILFDRVQEKLRAATERREKDGLKPDRSAGQGVSRVIGNTVQRADGLVYYLRERVFCGVCGRSMTPKGAKGSLGYVGYYECTTCSKAEGPCPVGRVNAYALHQMILFELIEIGKYPSRLDLFIRDTVRALPPPERHTKTLEALWAEERRIDRGLERLTRAISIGGGTVQTLVTEIRRLEAEKKAIGEQRLKIRDRVLTAEATRPDPKYIAACLGIFGLIWDVWTEEERSEALPRLVNSVVLNEKNKGEADINLQVISTYPSLVRNSGVKGSPLAVSYEQHSANGLYFPSSFSLPLTIPRGGRLATRFPLSTRKGPEERERVGKIARIGK